MRAIDGTGCSHHVACTHIDHLGAVRLCSCSLKVMSSHLPLSALDKGQVDAWECRGCDIGSEVRCMQALDSPGSSHHASCSRIDHLGTMRL